MTGDQSFGRQHHLEKLHFFISQVDSRRYHFRNQYAHHKIQTLVQSRVSSIFSTCHSTTREISEKIPGLLWTSSKSSNTGKSNSDEAKTQEIHLQTIKTGDEKFGNSS
jgi:hypothetical protein